MAEWEQAIRFLTEVGHWSDDKRQEFIILSDTLGITMLVDAISNQKPEGATETTVLGPFFVENAKSLPYGANISESGDGEPTLVTGSVRGLDGEPVSEARLDVWQAGPDGFYDVQHPNRFPDGNLRGVFKTDETAVLHFVQSNQPRIRYPRMDLSVACYWQQAVMHGDLLTCISLSPLMVTSGLLRIFSLPEASTWMEMLCRRSKQV